MKHRLAFAVVPRELVVDREICDWLHVVWWLDSREILRFSRNKQEPFLRRKIHLGLTSSENHSPVLEIPKSHSKSSCLFLDEKWYAGLTRCRVSVRKQTDAPAERVGFPFRILLDVLFCPCPNFALALLSYAPAYCPTRLMA
jgi:hypothetical protein